MTNLQRAVGECLTYNKMGGLDHQMILDIANDHDVSAKDIYRELEWDWPE